jgi:spermidine synthase
MTLRFESTLRISLFMLGFSALAAQVFLIRECFFLLNGNELVIGIVMANWMLLTGAGAYLARFFGRIKGKIPFLLFLQFLFSVLPMLMLLKLDLWKALALPAGSVPGLIQVVASMFLFQLPFCLLNGFLFVACVHVLSELKGESVSSSSYVVESAGGMAAGLLVNLFILNFSGVFPGLHILLALNLFVCILFSFTCGIRLPKFFMVPVCLVFIAIPFFADLDNLTSRMFYPAQKLIFHRDTPYGKLDITMSDKQLNYYENGLLLFSSNNQIASEESVHFAMVQHPCPKKILLISGGISGTITEILKYHPDRIDYVELDPEIIRIGRQYAAIPDDDRICFITGDAREFIRQSGEKYDVVLVNLPEPATLLINRYYSVEFLDELKKVLSPGAVICESLPSTSDYVSQAAAMTNSTLFHTLGSQFRNVLILPGQRNYFLASDSSLSLKISSLVSRRGISNAYVNAWYFDENSVRERSEYLHSNLGKTAELNSDFKPVAFFQQLTYWTTMFEWNAVWAGIVILIVLIAVLLSLNRISLGLFTGGFTASSLQILILVSFQVICGYVFLATGFILALFMGGLALGAGLRRRLIPVPSGPGYMRVQVALALFSLGFPFVILAMSLPGMTGLFIQAVFVLLTLILSFITGLEFSLATALGASNPSVKVSLNYSADLFGSAFGAFLTTLVLLPFLGLMASSLVMVGVNLFSAGFLYLLEKKV